MPEVNENKRKKDQVQKSGCGSCACCFFPSKRKKIVEEQARENNESFMVASTDENVEPPPFVDDIPALVAGTCIGVHGFVKPECSRFAINLMCSRDPNSDIAAHFNPRLSQRYVVRNSRQNGHWGKEETTSIAKFDLARNKKFDLDIVITEREFLVAINGKHICGFVFRIPIAKVKVVQVEGAVQVYDVEYRKLQIYPQPSPQNVPFSVPVGDGQDKVDIQQLDMPFTAILPKGFQQGWQLEIQGRVKILPHAFYINLQKGSQLWPHPTIPLHLNPRFSTTHGKRLFVRNAWINGEWGQEECSAGFIFSPGSPFSIAIRRAEGHFAVWVDGQLAGEFKFRGAVDKIDAVYIHGDVVLRSLYMRQHVDDKYFGREDLKDKPSCCGY